MLKCMFLCLSVWNYATSYKLLKCMEAACKQVGVTPWFGGLYTLTGSKPSWVPALVNH